MSLPAALTLVPVHGRILHTDPAGTPAAGSVAFRIDQPLRDAADAVILGPTTLRATLDEAGEFTLELPATDAPGISPSGWAYGVAVSTDAWSSTFRLEVPAATVGTLELADVAPAVNPPDLVTYVLAATVGQPGGPAGPLDGEGLIPAGQVPGGGGDGVQLGGDLGGTTSSPQVTGTHLPAPLPLAQGGTGAVSASAARTSLGLGGAAVLAVGTTAGTVAAGDDARLSDARTPTSHATTHASGGTDPVTPAAIGAAPTTRQVIAGTGLTGGGDLTADRTLAVAYGTSGTTAAAGNDSRIVGAAQKSANLSDLASASTARTNLGAETAGAATVAVSAHAGATDPHGDRAYADAAIATAKDPGALLRAALKPAGRIETRSRLDSGVTSSAVTSGTLYLVPIWLPTGTVVGSISFVAGNTGFSTLTNQWFSLHDSSRVQLAVTSNDGSTAWAAQATKTLSVATVAAGPAASFTTTYSGVHYLGFLVTATTMSNMAGGGAGGAAMQNAAPGFGACNPGLSTPQAFPFIAAAPSGAGPLFYAWVA